MTEIADRCRECGRTGHDAVAHHDPAEAALVWARTVLVQTRIEGYLLAEGASMAQRALVWAEHEQIAASWARHTRALMGRP